MSGRKERSREKHLEVKSEISFAKENKSHVFVQTLGEIKIKLKSATRWRQHIKWPPRIIDDAHYFQRD